jgi:RND family efflux transporter MFP subunit
MKKTIYTIIILLAVAALVFKSKQLLVTRQAEVNASKPPVALKMRVTTALPKKGTLVETRRFLAQIQSSHGIKVTTKLAGMIEKMYVHTGQKVHKGDHLLKIDSTELRSNLDALKAALVAQESDLAQARMTDASNQKLYQAGALPRQKLDQFRVALSAKNAQVESTKQKIAQVEHQMTYLDITAPFDGQIDTVILHEGDLAVTGRPILAMSNGKKKLVFGFVPTVKTKIKPGQAVSSADRQIGKINTIYATSQNGLVNAEVALSKPISLPVGASIDIDVAIRATQGCILPDDTLIHTANSIHLMEYDEGHFSPIDVNVTAQNGGQVIVKPCPQYPVARGSEVRLAQLPAYDNVQISGADNGTK